MRKWWVWAACLLQAGVLCAASNQDNALATSLVTPELRASLTRDYEIDVRRVRLLPAGIAILVAVSALLRLPLHVARGGLREGVVLRLAEAQE